MNKNKIIKGTSQFLNLSTLSTLTLVFTLQFAFTGCASIDRKEEVIKTILEKENALLEKVKLERAQPEISQAVQQSESLKKAEAHLTTALDEILKANETVTTKIINQSKKEVLIERNERHSYRWR